MSAEAAGEPIHIVLTFDENFWAPAYATARSICLASRRRKDLFFHLCHTHLGPDKKRDLESIATEYGARLRFVELEALAEARDVLTGWRGTGKPRLHFARFLLDRVLPPDIARAIYIDSDFFVLAPIEELWPTDLGGNAIGAVQSADYFREAAGWDIRDRFALFDPADGYFNAGLLLVDMQRWRAEGVTEAARKLVVEDGLRLHDQDLLNLIFKRRWTALDTLWNIYARGRAAETFPVKALHYSGRTKPWYLLSKMAMKRIYRHTMTRELFYRYLRYRWARWWATRARRLVGMR